MSVLSLVAQSCLTLCNPKDCSPPGSSGGGFRGGSPGNRTGVGCHALLQRSFPSQESTWNAGDLGSIPLGKPFFMVISNQSLCVLSYFSRVWLFASLWAVARQAPLSMGSSRQGYCCGLLCPPPGDLADQGSSPRLLHLLHWQVVSWVTVGACRFKMGEFLNFSRPVPTLPFWVFGLDLKVIENKNRKRKYLYHGIPEPKNALGKRSRLFMP